MRLASPIPVICETVQAAASAMQVVFEKAIAADIDPMRPQWHAVHAFRGITAAALGKRYAPQATLYGPI